MKILFVALARSIWLFNINLLNPKGLSLQPVLERISQTYKFASSPKNILDRDERNALVFKSGTFVNSKGTPVVIGFSLYTDGFVADTTSTTNDADEFLTQLMGWITRDFGLVPPPEIRKAYVSQIDVECVTPLVQLNPKLKKFLESLDARVKGVDGKSRTYDVAGLSFWTEDINKPGAPPVVKFERKWNAPFSANHYFSQSALQTSEHMAVMNELEEILKA
jgi:hypothetical protein